MFRLATVADWWDVTRKSELSFLRETNNPYGVLKSMGTAFVSQIITDVKPRRVLEFGHGIFTLLFDLFGNQCEMWGIDEPNIYAPENTYSEFVNRQSHEKGAKFVIGLLGKNSVTLPDNFFDLVCSISVIEHVASDELEVLFKEISRILKPGGLAVNTYDIPYRYPLEHINAVFDAPRKAGLTWLDPDSNPHLKWDAEKVCFEDPRIVLCHFMHSLPDHERVDNWPGNYGSVFMVAKK